jgi:hypothetical protein
MMIVPMGLGAALAENAKISSIDMRRFVFRMNFDISSSAFSTSLSGDMIAPAFGAAPGAAAAHIAADRSTNERAESVGKAQMEEC